MAGRPNIDVVSRRLKPIYDWLEIGKNKKAIQEADKVLRKQPDLQCAKVLRALALLRIGKEDDCKEAMNTVIAEGTTNDDTLQCLSMCYKEMNQPEEICTLYENAVKLDPNNEEIVSHFFMSFVRVGNYKRQQQIAMQLYKLNPKNPYYFWAVMSIIMQSHASADVTTKKLTLQLAERMVAKFVNENRIESEAEILTYLYILELQSKVDAALKVLEGPLVKRITQQPENFVNMKKANYNHLMANYSTAASIYKLLITNEPDNWQHYVNYCSSVVSAQECLASNSENVDPANQNVSSKDVISNHLLEASKFLSENQTRASSSKEKYRSPQLGLLQMSLKLQAKAMDDDGLCGDLVEHLIHYIKENSNKMCCFGDIVNFLQLVPENRVKYMLDKVKKATETDSWPNGFPNTVGEIHQHIFYMQLSRKLGAYQSCLAEENEQHGDSSVEFYVKTSPMLADTPETDIRQNDTYLILAAHFYMSAVNQYIDQYEKEMTAEQKEAILVNLNQTIVKTCSLLEYGLSFSKGFCQYKLLLVKIYNLMGASELSYKAFEKLDLKHIQFDSLGHVLSFQMTNCARYTVAESIYSEMLKFYMSHFKETLDPLIMSYKYGSLTRIPEFVEFRERLNDSIHFAQVTAEQMMLSITMATTKEDLLGVLNELSIDPLNDVTNYERLRDNRDYTVMNEWEPTPQRDEDQLLEAFKADVDLLKIRNLTLRIVAGATSVVKNRQECNKNGVVNGNANPASCDISLVNDLVDSLYKISDSCDIYRKGSLPNQPLFGPDCPRIFVFARGEYLPVFLKHCSILTTLYESVVGTKGFDSWTGNCLKDAGSNFVDMLSRHDRLIDENLKISCIDALLPYTNKDILSQMSDMVQTIGVCLVMVMACHNLLTPIRKNFSKKNKKKKPVNTTGLPLVIPDFNSYLACVNSVLSKMQASIKQKVDLAKEKKELNTLNGYKSLVPTSSVEVAGLDIVKVCIGIDDSYIESLNSLSLAITSKLDCFELLKIAV